MREIDRFRLLDRKEDIGKLIGRDVLFLNWNGRNALGVVACEDSQKLDIHPHYHNVEKFEGGKFLLF